MANIKRIDGKNGVSFQITVTQGRDINGRQVRHYKTWKPEGRMTERQMQKAVERAAADFEREIEQGYQTDNRQTFSEYARYVIGLKRTAGAKEKTLNHYEYLPLRSGDRASAAVRYPPAASESVLSESAGRRDPAGTEPRSGKDRSRRLSEETEDHPRSAG